jgi:hypothetical protein
VSACIVLCSFLKKTQSFATIHMIHVPAEFEFLLVHLHYCATITYSNEQKFHDSKASVNELNE